jgi:phosphoglycolate phosphatase
MHLVQFFEQMEDVVRELAQRHLLSIVSSTTSQVIRQYLEREGIDEHFSDILGADIHTRKHIKIGMLFDKHGLAPKDCVMITDTTGDMKEASQVGVSSIGVVWGFHARETLESMQPYALAEVPADIPRLVDEYFAR